MFPRSRLTVPYVFSFDTGVVEAAVAIIVCNMSVIVPAVLRALDVGDPFMQEDTVDPNFSAVEIARITSTRIEPVELSIPNVHGTVVADSEESEWVTDTVGSRQRDSVDLGVKEDHKHRLTTQTSDVSLGDSEIMKAVPLADESDIADSLAQVRNSPENTKGDSP